MTYWLVSSGTNEEPHIHDDWRARERPWIDRYGDVWSFTRRPRIALGDRLVTYAVGSARNFGKGRVYSLLEVTSEPHPGEHERWRWTIDVRTLAGVPLLSQSPTLDDIGVRPASVRQHTHIRLTPEQGRRAEELIAARDHTEPPDETSPKAFEVHVSEEIPASESLGIQVTRVHRHLLEAAAGHIEAARYRESIIIAQAAAEACAARAIDALMRRHSALLQDALEANFGRDANYNLRWEGPQKVWTFLTDGDEINKHAFWDRYKAHTKRRNKVAHGRPEALDYKKAEADDSLNAATEFIDQIEQVTGGILGVNGW